MKCALIVGCVLCLAQQRAMAVTIDHGAIAGVTNVPQAVMHKLGILRWFFSHASVGGNMITGMNVLRQSDTNRYRMSIYNYDGDNGDSSYHGGIATVGTFGQDDYRADDPPVTSNGVIYECQRGNPVWINKLVCFSNSVASSGWRFPQVNVVMDKFCWIDPDANPTNYCASMNSLEGAFPETLFVYLTMPLTTETAGTDNDLRNGFNRYLRSFCQANNKWLLDVADVEAWATNAVQSTYRSGGVTNQLMVSGYAVGAGFGDYHLNVTGRRQVALAWYALGAALFQQDRDGDGMTDGDELIAGTRPKDASSRLLFTGSAGSKSNLVLNWTSSSNRYYSIQASSNLLSGGAWTNVALNIPARTPQNSYTTSVGALDAIFYRVGVQQ